MWKTLAAGNRIYVAGHRGLVGSAIVRALEKQQFSNIIARSRAELDLTDGRAVDEFFRAERPEFVFLAAAKVGGIGDNSDHPADFIRDNLQIQMNVIDSAWRFGVKKLLFLGSSCIYPKMTSQPITEDALMTGPLEPTNDAYAIAKIAGIKMAQSYRRQYGFDAISIMPTNVYGPGDQFDLDRSHVLPALLRRFHEAEVDLAPAVTVWGTGSPRREFIHCDDLADASVFLMDRYSSESIINVGVGADVSIRELAEMVRTIVGYEGAIKWDASKPDGTPRKLLDISHLSEMGWRAQVGIREGIQDTYRWYLDAIENGTARLQSTEP